MKLNEAIQKAVDGGWHYPECDVRWNERNFPVVCGHPLPCPSHNKGDNYSTLLDPLFWQALGRSMGWQKDEVRLKKLRGELEYEESYYNTAVEYPTETPQFYDALQRQTDRIRNIRDSIYAIENGLDWKTHWHRLIDHLAEGKSIESFFAPL